MTAQAITIRLVIFPGMTTIDFAGSHQIFSFLPNQQLHRIWKNLDPVETEERMKILPDTTFENRITGGGATASSVILSQLATGS